MITNAMTPTIVGTRLSYEPIMVPVHARKPWQGVVALGGFRTDNSRCVSAHRGRLW